MSWHSRPEIENLPLKICHWLFSVPKMKIILSPFNFTAILVASLSVLPAPASAQESNWTNAAWQDATWDARGCTNDARGQWFRDAKFGAFIH